MSADLQLLLALAGTLIAVPALISVAGFAGLHRKIVPVKRRALPKGTGGSTNGLRILIDPDQAPPTALEHEWDHVELIWKMGIVGHAIAKAISDRYRIYVEARAYAVSVRHGRSMASAARALAHHSYGFGLTEEQARRRIERHL